MPNQPRKRPRMPKLPLQLTSPPATPVHIRLRPPPRIPSSRNDAPDPIKTPFSTPYNQVVTRHPTPINRLSNSPLPNQSPVQSPPTQTPLPCAPRLSQTPHARCTPSESSGGLFSGHRPLTLDTLHPTPPTDRTELSRRTSLVRGSAVARRHDARVRRLSFGAELVAVKETSVFRLPSEEQAVGRAENDAERRKRGLLDVVDAADENGRDGCSATRRIRRRSIPDERHVTQDRYDSSQRDDFGAVEGVSVAGCVSEASDVVIPETPLPGVSIQYRTPETAVRRCRAPIWDGPITQIPETPTEQLPPREAPVYFVKTAITASAEVPSLEVSSTGREMSLFDEGGGRRMGLLWLDIGGGVRENGDDTRLGEDSDSASTEPPSPTRKEDANVPTRAQVFCRSVRVSIPAGGFRSPSPEPSATDL